MNKMSVKYMKNHILQYAVTYSPVAMVEFGPFKQLFHQLVAERNSQMFCGENITE